MRKGVCVIWVPLFFCVSLTIFLTLYSSLELWNSLHSDFCNLSNSVMALDMRSRRANRLLEEHDGENCNGEEEVQAMDNCHRLPLFFSLPLSCQNLKTLKFLTALDF